MLLTVVTTGAFVGYALDHLGAPLPWMIGPMFVTAAAAVLPGFPMPPAALRRTGQLLVASAVALNLSPAAMTAMASDLPYMIAAAIASVAGAVVFAIMLEKLTDVDARTGLLALLPGGPAEMAELAIKHGGRTNLVILSQTLRLGLTVTVLPLILLFTASSPSLSLLPEAPGSLPSTASVLSAAILAGLGLHALGISNAFFVGPLAVIGAAALFGLPQGPLPAWLVIVGQLFLGTALGHMLDPRRVIGIGRDLHLAVLSSVYLLCFGFGIALLLAAAEISSLGELALASSAGGVAEMSIAAKGFGYDPAYVAAYHLIRIFLIFSTIGWLLSGVRLLNARD